MQNLSGQRPCVRCRALLQYNQPFCSNCGIQQPQLAPPVQKKSTMSAVGIIAIVLVCSVIGSCALGGFFAALTSKDEKQQPSIVNVASTPTATPMPIVKTSPTPKPIGSSDERLQVAADVRNYLRDQDIPATVVASGTTLNVTYNYAIMDNNPDNAFFKQQGKQGLRKMANAGFETLKIGAYDSARQMQTRTFSLSEYRK